MTDIDYNTSFKIWNAKENRFLKAEESLEFLTENLRKTDPFILTLPAENPDLNPDYIICKSIKKYDKNGEEIFVGDLFKGYIYPFATGKDSAEPAPGEDPKFNYYLTIENAPELGAYVGVCLKIKSSSVSGLAHGSTRYIEEIDFSKFEKIGTIFENEDLTGF